MKEIKVVCGCNFGDCGKGLVSGCLGKEAVDKGYKVLTVFANGTIQRSHSYGDHISHCTGISDIFGGSTYYWPSFVIDPIALWITEAKVIFHPNCRVITPWDVMANRKKETARGDARHGSCGFGLFETVKRHKTIPLCASNLGGPWTLFEKLNKIKEHYAMEADEDEVYNIHNFHLAVDWMIRNCKCATLAEIENDFETIIFENGQGLLLSQTNVGEFPHLTPSSTGANNICKWINSQKIIPEIYYVSRTYLTRHGAGKMETECKKEDINKDIIDLTNQPNPWQGSLRFGYLDTGKMFEHINNDKLMYNNAIINMVYTQMNYTKGKLCIGKNKFAEIEKPDFISNIYVSDTKDSMELFI